MGRPWKRTDDLGREVVGGRAEPAARYDEVGAALGEEAQGGEHVLGPVGHDHGEGEVDAELAQAVREPRAVAIGHAPGEHLGAGDDDAGPCAHPRQLGQLARGSDFTRAGGVIS